ncbi:glycosyltransferase family 4 protein [candidate division KSB1 bacterium]|nr:glycosyltransferase family 4 protein [candidate division KSB1 bacterium]RQW10214.1 MAG: glycosyltransferase family 1 protein [candidate division KSB1 bacterium]
MNVNIHDGDEVEKLRILMIAPQPWFQPRGTPFSVLHRIKALSLLGHKVDLVTYHVGEDVSIDNLSIHRAAKVPFIKKVKIGPSLPKIFLDIALYFKAVELLKKFRYDYLHTHEEAGFFGVSLAAKYGLPHLYDMHSSLPQQLGNFKFSTSKLLLELFEALERQTIRKSAGVITICPELQSYVEKKFPDQRCMLIENVADNSIVFPATAALQESLKKQYNINGAKIVLYYGTFEAYQGIDMLVESAARVEKRRGDVRFLMVGGNEQQVSMYRAQAQKLGVESKFTFTGFVPPNMIPGFVSLSDVLVSPRLQGSNSPLKIYSYLRSGKPIVATRHITHTQILSDSTSVLADPNPEAFAEALLSILDDRDAQRRLVAAAQHLAEQHYSYDDYLQKTKWIVERVMRTTG